MSERCICREYIGGALMIEPSCKAEQHRSSTGRGEAPAKRCGSCRSFRRNPKVIGQGICKWGPPQCVPVMAGTVPSIMSARPPVNAEESCDQWSSADAT